MPDLAAINTSVQKAIHPTPSPQQIDPRIIQYIMYGLQGIDSVNSANAFRKYGMHEANPMMRPFSHAGPLGMAAGFGIGDLVRHIMMRHASQGTRNTADAAQAASNLEGILQTNARAAQIGNP